MVRLDFSTIQTSLFSLADNFRPYLTSFQGNSFTDYINAVFVDVTIDGFINKNSNNILFCQIEQGYTRPREYIVTEWPLPHTLGDLWSLVYDYDCSAVVVLTNPPPSSVSWYEFSQMNFRFIFLNDSIRLIRPFGQTVEGPLNTVPSLQLTMFLTITILTSRVGYFVSIKRYSEKRPL